MEGTDRHQPDYPIGLLLHAANIHKDKILDDYLTGKDISSAQLKVLLGIYRGLVTPSDLTRHMGIDSGALSRMLERMVKHGVVMRQSVPEDRRLVHLELTEKGRQFCDEFKNDGMINLPAKITERLTADEVRIMTKLLLKMLPEDIFKRYFPYQSG
ncbi:MarR family transcriptional regulator [Pantoea stewartii]|uniref:MarR family transcriptional regulator n=1 Tax=Pantoea stewartii TaxID=66269 RepID=UPI00345BBA4A